MSCQGKKYIQDKPTESSMQGHCAENLWKATARRRKLALR